MVVSRRSVLLGSGGALALLTGPLRAVAATGQITGAFLQIGADGIATGRGFEGASHASGPHHVSRPG